MLLIKIYSNILKIQKVKEIKKIKLNKIKKMIKQNKIFQNYLLALIFILCLGFLFYYVNKNSNFQSSNINQSAVVSKTLDFINKNLLNTTKAEVKEVKQESGVYKITLKIENEEAPIFVSKDGNLIFLQAINVKEFEKSQQQNNKITKCEEINKTNTPVLEAYVVSQCPFGLQTQRALNEVVKNIPQLEKYIIVRYIGEIKNGKIESMHGDEEAQENLRQICIREEQKDKYWPYIDCYIKEGKTNDCLKITKVDLEKLNNCLKDNSRGLNYAQKDFEKTNKFNISGSPTLMINEKLVDEFKFGGRTAEALKNIICCGLKNKIEECNKTLNTEQAATGFSLNYSSGNNSNYGTCQ